MKLINLDKLERIIDNLYNKIKSKFATKTELELGLDTKANEVHDHESITGNAGSATKLKNSKTLTIGNSSKTFDGSNDVSWNLFEIGATEKLTWICAVRCSTWSRLFHFKSGDSITGGSFVVSIRGTRGNVVYNVTLMVNFSHADKCHIVQLNNTSYSNISVRSVVDGNGTGYFEMYDDVNSATNAMSQNVIISVVNVSDDITITKYTNFIDGTTIPSGYSKQGEIRTVSGSYYTGTAAMATKIEAKTLTIGNSGKSFDGSSNVSWSINEIGAAPASHGNHMPNQCISITDWNSAIHNGWYMGHNAANSPLADRWFMGTAICHNDNYVIQHVYEFTSGEINISNVIMYSRVKWNGSWGGWTGAYTIAGEVSNWWNKNVVVGGNGVVEVGKYMDWHLANGSATDYDGRLTLVDTNNLHWSGTIQMSHAQIGGHLITISSSAPGSPAVGGIWIQV